MIRLMNLGFLKQKKALSYIKIVIFDMMYHYCIYFTYRDKFVHFQCRCDNSASLFNLNAFETMISAKYTSFHMTKQQIDTDLSDNYRKNIAIR